MDKRYFEFNKHEYYALIQADDEEHAYILYHYIVAGESVEEVKLEGKPDELTQSGAYIKYANVMAKYGHNATEVWMRHDFNGIKNDIVLIDGSLV